MLYSERWGNRVNWFYKAMRRRILISIAVLFYYSGLVALARWWTRRTQACLIILNYHRASGGNLRKHLLYLRKHYNIVPVEDALESLYAPSGQKSQNQRSSLVVTFDDGYYDNYSEALPLAKELQIPLTMYLVPAYIESGRHFWWEEGQHLSQQMPEREVAINGRKYDLTQASGRDELAHVIDYFMRHARSVTEREQFLETVAQTFHITLTPAGRDKPSLPVTWEQVLEMDRSGWITFGGHTMHHPILAYLADEAEVRREVNDCRIVLEQKLGHPVYSFAYPIGQRQHIGDVAIQAVRDAGFKWAMTTLYGFNTPQTDPYRLRRIEVDVDQHWLVVAAETAGLWGFLSRLRWLPFVRKYFMFQSLKWAGKDGVSRPFEDKHISELRKGQVDMH